jgi:hypothetical protein
MGLPVLMIYSMHTSFPLIEVNIHNYFPLWKRGTEGDLME